MADVLVVIEPVTEGGVGDLAVTVDPFVAGLIHELAQVKDGFTPRTIFVNRVYDTGAGDFVRWETFDSPDPTGTSYPGPGTFGVNTSDYAIESIR